MDLNTVTAGLRAGLPYLLPVFALQLVLVVASDDPNDAWAVLLLALLLVAFGRAGAAAARHTSRAALAHAAGAGVAVFLAWLPLRLLIAVVGDSDRPFGGLGAGLALGVLVSLGAGVVAMRQGASDPG